MASNDETIKLILELTGTETVRDAITALEKMSETAKETGKAEEYLKLQTLQYQAALDSTTDTTDEAVRAAAEQTQSYRLMSQVLDDELNPALTRTVDTSGDVAASMGGTPKHGGPSFGRAILQAQYAMDDFSAVYRDGGFQRAFASMQNNIPQVALALGAGAGMTGVIGGMAVAASLAIPYIKAFWDELAGRAPGAEEALKKVNDEWDKLTAKPTKEEAEAGKKVGEAFVEGDAKKITGVLAGALSVSGRADMARMTDKEKEQLAFFEFEKPGSSKEMADAIQKRLNEENINRIKGMMVAAQGVGPEAAGARASLRAIAEPVFKALPPGFIGALAEAEPAAMKQQKQIEDQAALNIENMARHDRERKAEVGKTQGEAAKEAGIWKQRLNKMDAEFKDEQQTEGEWNRHLQQMRQHDDRDAKRIADKKRHDDERAAKQAQHQEEQAQRNQTRMAEWNLREMNAQIGRYKEGLKEQVGIGQMSADIAKALTEQADAQLWINQENMRKLAQPVMGGAQPR